MPTPGECWRHIVLNTHSTWLHGDPRGFRSRGHRIHSSGDYRNPPPSGEHRGLLHFQIFQSKPKVTLPLHVFEAMGEAIVVNLQKHQHALAALYVGSVHTHLLVELPDDLDIVRKACGWTKCFATRAARAVEPTLRDVEIWAEGEGYTPVKDESHFRNTIEYILFKQSPTGWTWAPDKSVAW